MEHTQTFPLFTSSPIDGVSLFSYPFTPLPRDAESEVRLPIGKQIEEALLAALTSDPRYEVLTYGMQVQQDGITLGELDFIIRDLKDSTVFHLELVHKFYIYRKQSEHGELESWIGPNYRDRLTYKVDKLRDHQFPLLFDPSTLPYLQALGLDPAQMEQRLCFNAELYCPESIRPKAGSLIDLNAICGEFLFYTEFLDRQDEHGEYRVCTKQDWIQDMHTFMDWYDLKTCHEHLAELASNGHAVMIWKRMEKGFERTMVLFK